jgi:hypothetical protein
MKKIALGLIVVFSLSMVSCSKEQEVSPKIKADKSLKAQDKKDKTGWN